MGLIKCKECGKDISEKAKICPSCGYSNKKEINKLIIIIPIVVAVIGMICLLFGGNITKNMKTSEENKLLNSTIETIYSEGNKIEKYIDKAYEIYDAGGSAVDYWKETKEEADKFYETFDIVKKDVEQLDNDKLDDFYNKYKGLLSMSMAVGGDSIRDKYDTLCTEFEQAYKDLKENNN